MLTPWFTAYKLWDVSLTDTSCQWIVSSIKLMFLYPKSLGLYFVYFDRLFYIFKGSAHEFRRWQMYLLRAMLIGGTLCITLVVFLNAKDNYVLDPETNSCTARFSANGVVIGIAGDLLICNLLSSLYCRRLLVFRTRLATRFLAHPAGAAAGNQPPADLQAMNQMFKLMVKSTVLQFVASFSSQLSVILMWILGVPSLWASIDSVINCWCLVLMFDIYDDLFHLYPKCCGLCEKLLCYQCIVCYSCHCCCKVNRGEIRHSESEMT